MVQTLNAKEGIVYHVLFAILKQASDQGFSGFETLEGKR